MKKSLILLILVLTKIVYSQDENKYLSIDLTEERVYSIKEVEQYPLTRNCKLKKDKEKNKKCFSISVSKYINKKFNTNLAAELDGKIKILVSFVITKTGEIANVEAISEYEILSKEAIRVVSSIPKMKPAYINNKAVNVQVKDYPIVFYIHE
ncbi:MAG: hypothetical protein COA88_07240 [Kordia sp.]|nr:MAG: hypothetical protein COA88_07240 [Kordia sp.]